MFEQLSVPSLYIALPAVLSLYASGRTTGLVLGSGERTHSVPVYEGHPLCHYAQDLSIGGSDLTLRTRSELTSVGYSFTCQTSDVSSVRDIKETLCYISPRRYAMGVPSVESSWPTIPNLEKIDQRCAQLRHASMNGTYFQRLPLDLLPNFYEKSFTKTLFFLVEILYFQESEPDYRMS